MYSGGAAWAWQRGRPGYAAGTGLHGPGLLQPACTCPGRGCRAGPTPCQPPLCLRSLAVGDLLTGQRWQAELAGTRARRAPICTCRSQMMLHACMLAADKGTSSTSSNSSTTQGDKYHNCHEKLTVAECAGRLSSHGPHPLHPPGQPELGTSPPHSKALGTCPMGLQ